MLALNEEIHLARVSQRGCFIFKVNFKKACDFIS